MEHNIAIKISKSELKKICLIFIFLFFSNDTYLFGTNSNELMVAIPRYLMLGFCIINIIFVVGQKEYFYHGNIIKLYVIMLVSLVIVSLYHHEYYSRVLIKILCMTTAMFLCMKYRLEDYAEAFMKCMSFFSIWAILLTLLAYIKPSIVTFLPCIVNTAGIKFYSIGLAGLDERSIGSLTVRTGGIFWEPGVFQMYLNLAILFEIFLYYGNNKKRLCIYTIALILTFSTTGYLAFMWIITTFILFGHKNNIIKIKNLLIFIGFPIVAFFTCLIMIYTNIGQTVFGKLFNIKDGSTMVRLASVLINLDIMKEHPFAGIGMASMADEFERRSYLSSIIWGWTRQNTNTLLYQFAAHGLFFGIPFTIGTYQLGGKLTTKLFMKLSIFIMFLMLYIGENLMTSIFPYILVFYGIDHLSKSYKDIDKKFSANRGLLL